MTTTTLLTIYDWLRAIPDLHKNHDKMETQRGRAKLNETITLCDRVFRELRAGLESLYRHYEPQRGWSPKFERALIKRHEGGIDLGQEIERITHIIAYLERHQKLTRPEDSQDLKIALEEPYERLSTFMAELIREKERAHLIQFRKLLPKKESGFLRGIFQPLRITRNKKVHEGNDGSYFGPEEAELIARSIWSLIEGVFTILSSLGVIGIPLSITRVESAPGGAAITMRGGLVSALKLTGVPPLFEARYSSPDQWVLVRDLSLFTPSSGGSSCDHGVRGLKSSSRR